MEFLFSSIGEFRSERPKPAGTEGDKSSGGDVVAEWAVFPIDYASTETQSAAG